MLLGLAKRGLLRLAERVDHPHQPRRRVLLELQPQRPQGHPRILEVDQRVVVPLAVVRDRQLEERLLIGSALAGRAGRRLRLRLRREHDGELSRGNRGVDLQMGQQQAYRLLLARALPYETQAREGDVQQLARLVVDQRHADALELDVDIDATAVGHLVAALGLVLAVPVRRLAVAVSRHGAGALVGHDHFCDGSLELERHAQRRRP